MRILFFTDGLVAGGKERRLVELMRAIRARPNVEFELVVMDDEIHYQQVFDLNIKIHYLIRTAKRDISVFHKFYKICKNFRPDIIHCWDSMTAVYSIPPCRLLNIKLINGLIADAPGKFNFFNRSWFRVKLTFLFSNIIVGNSKAGLKAYHAPQKKSIYIYNGFNFDRLNSVATDCVIRQQLEINTPYVIGMVASFAANKDYKTYYNAAQLILDRRNDITFLAIGKKTDSEASKNLIPEKYKSHFRLLGKISDIESFVGSMDICVLSTFTEGISNSILEYMALGKPVIASLGGGTNEIVEDSKTGFLISPLNPEELAEKIEILLNDPALGKEFGRAGQERIKSKFSIDHMVKEYLSVYESALMNNLV